MQTHRKGTATAFTAASPVLTSQTRQRHTYRPRGKDAAFRSTCSAPRTVNRGHRLRNTKLRMSTMSLGSTMRPHAMIARFH